MGASFLRGFYTVYDMDAVPYPRIGFAPLVGSGKAPITRGTEPYCAIEARSSCSGRAVEGERVSAGKFWLTLIIVILIFIVLPAFLLYWFFLRPTPDTKKTQDTTE